MYRQSLSIAAHRSRQAFHTCIHAVRARRSEAEIPAAPTGSKANKLTRALKKKFGRGHGDLRSWSVSTALPPRPAAAVSLPPSACGPHQRCVFRRRMFATNCLRYLIAPTAPVRIVSCAAVRTTTALFIVIACCSRCAASISVRCFVSGL